MEPSSAQSTTTHSQSLRCTTTNGARAYWATKNVRPVLAPSERGSTTRPTTPLAGRWDRSFAKRCSSKPISSPPGEGGRCRSTSRRSCALQMKAKVKTSRAARTSRRMPLNVGWLSLTAFVRTCRRPPIWGCGQRRFWRWPRQGGRGITTPARIVAPRFARAPIRPLHHGRGSNQAASFGATYIGLVRICRGGGPPGSLVGIGSAGA
jgi:hypothetical protein